MAFPTPAESESYRAVGMLRASNAVESELVSSPWKHCTRLDDVQMKRVVFFLVAVPVVANVPVTNVREVPPYTTRVE